MGRGQGRRRGARDRAGGIRHSGYRPPRRRGRLVAVALVGAALGLTAGAYMARTPSVTADSAAPPPPVAAIRLNQLGFIPEGPKTAILVSQDDRPVRWTLTNGKGGILATGRTSVFGPDEASGQSVHRIDFSAVTETGTGFRLQTDAAFSHGFSIQDHPFRTLKTDALHYFYHNRAGTPIEARHVGQEQWARPAGHRPERASCFSGTDQKGNRWPGCDHTLDVTGGWYDAGDFGKYVTPAARALWTLLNLHERRIHRGLRPAFPDGSAPIPEAGNGVNDLLDEARWELDWLLSMQIPEGARMAVPVGDQRKSNTDLVLTEIDASGLVHERVHGAEWPPIPQRPDRDRMDRFLFPPATQPTLNFAAITAQAARLWREIDPAFAARCLSAAERAFEAAARHPDLWPYRVFSGGGGPIHTPPAQDMVWAAAELFITTGNPAYREILTASTPIFGDDDPESPWDVAWPPYEIQGLMSLATAPNDLTAEERARVAAAILVRADRLMEHRDKQGYRIPYELDKTYWGSNWALLFRAVVLGIAHDVSGEKRYRDGVVDVMDYVLGRNPLDQSYVSGYGVRTMRFPHHRFWAAGYDPRYPGPPPGALSGGANGHTAGKNGAQGAGPDCAPLTCWEDDARDFAFNEVAIYWNGVLLWATAYLDGGA